MFEVCWYIRFLQIFKASVKGQSSFGFYVLKMFPKTKRGIAAFTNEREILKEIYLAHNPYIVELNCFLQTPVRVCVAGCSLAWWNLSSLSRCLFWKLRKWSESLLWSQGHCIKTQILISQKLKLGFNFGACVVNVWTKSTMGNYRSYWWNFIEITLP